MWHFLISFAAGVGLGAWIWYPGYRSFWDSQKERSVLDHWEL